VNVFDLFVVFSTLRRARSKNLVPEFAGGAPALVDRVLSRGEAALALLTWQ